MLFKISNVFLDQKNKKLLNEILAKNY